MSLNVQVVGLDDFLADVKASGIDAAPLVKGALQNSATETQRLIRTEAPHKTGALQGSVLTAVNYPYAEVTTDSPYAEFVEDGTAPHIIQPVNKKALYWKGAYSPVKLVHHPGTKANPFFARGVTASTAYIVDQFNKVTARLVQIMADH